MRQGSGRPLRARALVLGAALSAILALAAPGPAGAASPPIPRLTLTQLAGQRVIYSYPGPNPPASLFARIRAGYAAGVIFFGENIQSRAQIAGVVRRLQVARLSSPVHSPLLLMTDQEGGIVKRLPGQPVLRPSRSAQSADSTGAARAGRRRRGANMRGVGMNVNLAPVLGVFRHAGDFLDQFQRSFSSDPEHRVAAGVRVPRRPAEAGRGRHGQALPGPRRRERQPEHGRGTGDAAPLARHAAQRRHAPLSRRDRERRAPGDDVVGDLSGARPRAVRPGSRAGSSRASSAAGSGFAA